VDDAPVLDESRKPGRAPGLTDRHSSLMVRLPPSREASADPPQP